MACIWVWTIHRKRGRNGVSHARSTLWEGRGYCTRLIGIAHGRGDDACAV